VLKVVVPHPEATHEPDALRDWAGEGAVRLLDQAPEEHALLLERCRPGVALRKAGRPDDEVLDVGAEVALALWRPAPPSPYVGLGDVTAGWADLVEERAATQPVPVGPTLLAEGAALLRELPATADREVLLHGDLHPANLLAAERDPWLAIDPKPVRGDPAFDLPPMVLQTGELLGAPDPAAELDRRLRRVAAATGVDADRIHAWALARSVEVAVWAVAVGAPEPHLDAAAWARLLAR
jgi:streptomycin 6-kinase